jgi:hypothetical protein
VVSNLELPPAWRGVQRQAPCILPTDLHLAGATTPVCGVPELTPVSRRSGSTVRPCNSGRGPRPTQAHGIVRDGTDNCDSHRPIVGPLRESCIGYSVPQPIGCLGVAPENTLCDQSQLPSTQPGKARHARVPLSPRFSGPEFCILAQAPTNALLFRIPTLTVRLSWLERGPKADLQRDSFQNRKSKTHPFPRGQAICCLSERPKTEPPLVVERFLYCVICTVYCIRILCVLLGNACKSVKAIGLHLPSDPPCIISHVWPCPRAAVSGSCRSLPGLDWIGEPKMHQARWASRSKSRSRPAEERQAWHPWLEGTLARTNAS